METSGPPTGWLALADAFEIARSRYGYPRTSKAFLRQLRNINDSHAKARRPILRETTKPGARQPRYEVHFGRLREAHDSPVDFSSDDYALEDRVDDLEDAVARLSQSVKELAVEVRTLRKAHADRLRSA